MFENRTNVNTFGLISRQEPVKMPLVTLTPAPSSIYGTDRPHWTPEAALDCPFGMLMCAICTDPVPADARQLLLPEEGQFAATLEAPDRHREWIAGRVSMAAALSKLSAPRLPILPLPWGPPSIPPGFAGSISHKGPLTVALADVAVPAVGVDVECVEASDQKLAMRILTDRERSRLQPLDDADKALFITAHFALKEAIFKALREEDQSLVDFENIELTGSVAQPVPGVWSEFGASVMTCASYRIRASLFCDQGWIVAAASRQ